MLYDKGYLEKYVVNFLVKFSLDLFTLAFVACVVIFHV